MLRRIGFGLLLRLCSFALSAVLGNMLLCSSNLNVTCLFFYSEMFNLSSNGLWWSLSPSTIYYLGYLISLITLFEFVFAQTPRSILGMMSGLIILSVGLSSILGYGVCQLALNTLSNTHADSLFSSGVSVAFVSLVYFISFACTSKWYKLRKRDDIVSIHMFAEEFIEKELEGQRRLENEWSKRTKQGTSQSM